MFSDSGDSAGGGGERGGAAEAAGQTLTERDYLAIGICAGFLAMLYIFAMIVFIIIKELLTYIETWNRLTFRSNTALSHLTRVTSLCL